MKFRAFLIITTLGLLVLALSVGWQLHRQRQGSELCAAIKAGDTTYALELLHSGADPNTREPVNPDTTSMQALRRLWNHWRGQLTGKETDNGVSALQLAVQEDNVAVIKDLLERGASDINARAEAKDNVYVEEPQPLVIAVASNKHPDLVWMLLKRGAAQSLEEKERLLCAAAYSNNLELVHYLVNSGVNANGGVKWDEDNYPDRLPPLVHAVRSRNVAMTALLLEHHARTNFTCDGTRASVMTTAAENGDNAIIKLLLARGTNVDLEAKEGTPLCFAARRGNFEIVKTLVAAGANVNRNGYGGSVLTNVMPVDDVSESKRLPILKLLLAKGAKPNDSTRGEWTATLSAAYEGDIKILKLLLDYGADINHYDSLCETALTIAVEKNHLNVARLLLSRGARIRMIGYSDYGDINGSKRIDAMQKAKTPAMKALLQHYDRH